MLDDDDERLSPTHLISTPARIALRDSIMDALLNAATSKQFEQPRLFLMGGGSASGKGTTVKRLKLDGQIPDNDIVEIDPDEIKISLPPYQELVDLGDPRAASVVHIESRDLAVDTFAVACIEQKDILLDRTLASVADAQKIIETARNHGYRIILIGVTVDIDIAIDRARERGRETGRYVPEEAIRATHKGFSRTFPDIVELVDEAHLFDTGQGDDHIIAQKGYGAEFVILDEEAYNSFLSKRDMDDNPPQQD